MMTSRDIRRLMAKRYRIPQRPEHSCALLMAYQTRLLNTALQVRNEADMLPHSPRGFREFKKGTLEKLDLLLNDAAELNTILVERLNCWEQHVDMLQSYIDDLQKALKEKP